MFPQNSFPTGREIIAFLFCVFAAGFVLGYGLSTFLTWLGS